MSEKSVKTLANSFAIGGNAANVAAQPLKLLADVRPDMILPYDDLIITNLDTNSMLACHIPAIMAHLAHADKVRGWTSAATKISMKYEPLPWASAGGGQE